MTGTDDKKEFKIYMNELLYYVHNAKNSVSKEDIVQRCSEFYTEKEIDQAKLFLLQTCGSSEGAENLKQKMKDRRGINKVINSLNDIVDFIMGLDWKLCLVRFGALNAARVPPILADLSDMALLRNEVSELKSQNGNMSDVMTEILQMKTHIHTLTVLVEKLSSANNIDRENSISKNARCSEDIVGNTASSSKCVRSGVCYSETIQNFSNIIFVIVVEFGCFCFL